MAPGGADREPGKEATIYSFGLIVGPQTDPDTLASAATRQCLEVVVDGGVLIRLDGCPSAARLVETIERLDADGVVVHRVAELPTDPSSPSHEVARACSRALARGR